MATMTTMTAAMAEACGQAPAQHFDKSKQGYGTVLKAVMHNPNLSKGAKAFYAELASTMGRCSYGFSRKKVMLEKCHISEASYYKYRKELMRAGALYARARYGEDGSQKSSLIIIATHDEDGCPVMPNPAAPLFDRICGTKDAGDLSVLGCVKFVEPRGGIVPSAAKDDAGSRESASPAMQEAADKEAGEGSGRGLQEAVENPVLQGTPHPKSREGAHPKEEGGLEPQNPRSDTGKPLPKTIDSDNEYNMNIQSDKGQVDAHARTDGRTDSSERESNQLNRAGQPTTPAEKAEAAFLAMDAVTVNRNCLRKPADRGECADRVKALVDEGIDPRAIVAAWDARQKQAADQGREARYFPQLKRWLFDTSEIGARDMAKAKEEARRRKIEAKRNQRLNEAVQRDPKLKGLLAAVDQAKECLRLGVGSEDAVGAAIEAARAYARSLAL